MFESFPLRKLNGHSHLFGLNFISLIKLPASCIRISQHRDHWCVSFFFFFFCPSPLEVVYVNFLFILFFLLPSSVSCRLLLFCGFFLVVVVSSSINSLRRHISVMMSPTFLFPPCVGLSIHLAPSSKPFFYFAAPLPSSHPPLSLPCATAALGRGRG